VNSLSLSLCVRAHACVEVRMPLKMQMHIFLSSENHKFVWD
jgi:hypothetical protein